MVTCFYARCNHRPRRNECSFFRFPKDKKLRAFWTRFSRRADKEPDDNCRLCSCHFKDGKKMNKPGGYFDLNFECPEKPTKRIRTKMPVNNEDQNKPGPSEIKNTRLDVLFLPNQVDALRTVPVNNKPRLSEIKNTRLDKLFLLNQVDALQTVPVNNEPGPSDIKNIRLDKLFFLNQVNALQTVPVNNEPGPSEIKNTRVDELFLQNQVDAFRTVPINNANQNEPGPSEIIVLEDVLFLQPQVDALRTVPVNSLGQNEPGPSEIKNPRLDVIFLQNQIDALQKENAMLKEKLKNYLYSTFNL